MPFLDVGGPVGAADARAALARAAADEALRGRADLLELRTRQTCDALSTSHRKLAVSLSLPATSDELWRRFPSKLRSQIKRPRAAGCETRFGLDQRHAFWEIYVRHLRDLGSPALGKQLFDGLAAVFPDLVEFAVVYDATGRAVAGGCGFRWRGKFDLVWAASLRSANASAPNMLLYWSFMERCIGHGLSTFDFGRCSPGSGTHRFKRQWGGVDVELPWAQWSASGVDAPPTAARPHFAVASAIWRRLPPPLTRACGPALARLIP
jgi:FemAB-related protein (PEP-CTERM system-associated)